VKLLRQRSCGRLINGHTRPVLWLTTALHLVWGAGLVLAPEVASRTTGLAPFRDAPEFWGLVFLASATLAIGALIREVKGWGITAGTFFSFLPQQALLMVSAFSVLYYVDAGHFADGTVVPSAAVFIFVDQLPKVLLALMHPFGVLRMHRRILPAPGTGSTDDDGR